MTETWPQVAHFVITSVPKFNVQILPNGTRSRAFMADFCPTSGSECFSCQNKKRSEKKKGDSVTEVGREEQELERNAVKTAISAGNVIKNSKKQFRIFQGEY